MFGISIDHTDRETRMRWAQVTVEDTARIPASARLVRPKAREIVRRFYDHAFQFSALSTKVSEAGNSRERLEVAQYDYLSSLLDIAFDGAYFDHRIRIGAIEERAARRRERLTAISAIAQESAASSEEVSASTEEVSAQIAEVATQSASLTRIATELPAFLEWLGAGETEAAVPAALPVDLHRCQRAPARAAGGAR